MNFIYHFITPFTVFRFTIYYYFHFRYYYYDICRDDDWEHKVPNMINHAATVPVYHRHHAQPVALIRRCHAFSIFLFHYLRLTTCFRRRHDHARTYTRRGTPLPLELHAFHHHSPRHHHACLTRSEWNYLPSVGWHHTITTSIRTSRHQSHGRARASLLYVHYYALLLILHYWWWCRHCRYPLSLIYAACRLPPAAAAPLPPLLLPPPITIDLSRHVWWWWRHYRLSFTPMLSRRAITIFIIEIDDYFYLLFICHHPDDNIGISDKDIGI